MLKNILSFIAGPAYIKKTTGEIQDCNNAFNEMFKLEKSDILNKKEDFIFILGQNEHVNMNALDIKALSNPGVPLKVFIGQPPKYIYQCMYSNDSNVLICLIDPLPQPTDSASQAQITLENILGILPGHVYWQNTEGVFLGCNDQQAIDAGLKSRFDVIGKKNEDLPWREQAEYLRMNNEEVMASKKIHTIEEPCLLPNGIQKAFLTKKAPLFNGAGEVIGTVGVSFDITAEKETEQLRKEVEEAQLKIQFNKQAAGTIAHDLRTPLASINSFYAFLKDELPELFEGYKKARDADLLEGRTISNRDFALYNEAVDSIKRVVDYSNHYINMILGNLKHDTIKTDGYQVFSLADEIKKAVEDYPYNGSEKQFLHLNTDTDFQIWGDTFYITNIINNLLKNAFYFLRAAGKGEINIWLETGDSENYLHVKDTAKGAPKEVCEQMFGAYFSAREGDTGLGLAFCQSIMHSFKGDIKAESVEGEYMHFILSFPKQS